MSHLSSEHPALPAIDIPTTYGDLKQLMTMAINGPFAARRAEIAVADPDMFQDLRTAEHDLLALLHSPHNPNERLPDTCITNHGELYLRDVATKLIRILSEGNSAPQESMFGRMTKKISNGLRERVGSLLREPETGPAS